MNVPPALVPAATHVVEPAPGVVGSALVPQAAMQLPLLLGVRDDDATFTRRDLLVRIEAEDPRRPVSTERRPLVLGSERLRRVLDQGQPMALAQRSQLVELAGVSEHVDRDNGLRAL